MKTLIVALVLVLAACTAAGKRGAQPPAVYDLGPPAAPLAGPAATPPLALEVRAPAWLDTPGIAYRLAYAESGRRRDYAQARWAAPPAQLVQQRLAQQLGLVQQGQGGAACLLRIDVDEFSQVFAAPERSHASLRARLRLLDRGGGALAERAVAIERLAASPDSRGGVAALTAAVEQLASEVAEWRAGLGATGKLAACGK